MKARPLAIYALLFLAVACVSPWIGDVTLSRPELAASLQARALPDWYADILIDHRIPRVILGLLAGGTLAVVGASFQVLFRNPLVEPYTMGITGGAALGAFLTIAVPRLAVTWGPFGSLQLFALAGTALTLALLYVYARRGAGMNVYTLLLAGVTISIICAGAIMLISYLADPYSLAAFHHWMMGGLSVLGYRQLAGLFPLLVPGLGLLFLHANDLNHLALGEETALGHGVAVSEVQRDVFIGGGLATAAVVSLVGPIGFVGLIIPHAVRRISGFDQRLVLPASFLLGGAALATCDAVARTLIAPTEIPVGIITAIVGGPLFIRLLLQERR